MSCKIYCQLHNKEERDYNITAEGRVWPCCFFSNAWDKRLNQHFPGMSLLEVDRFKSDKKLMSYVEEDFDFNNLNVYDLDTVLSHELFTDYAFYDGWDSDTPPVICEFQCGVVQAEDGTDVIARSIKAIHSEKDNK